jgi:hypothetical protein
LGTIERNSQVRLCGTAILSGSGPFGPARGLQNLDSSTSRRRYAMRAQKAISYQ